ncbi:MAG: hypothetical protein HW397_349, partial [Dehalococcoidia bacterium]|nr:hypothetical protein [Dehalococcoidia bacterium]
MAVITTAGATMERNQLVEDS